MSSWSEAEVIAMAACCPYSHVTVNQNGGRKADWLTFHFKGVSVCIEQPLETIAERAIIYVLR